MTQEEKQLLLKDLCCRSPYDVMVDYESHIYILNEVDPACKDIDYITVRIQDVERLMCAKSTMIEDIKPYLRPMSSMTEEEKREIYDWLVENDVDWFDFSKLRLDEILISFDSSWLLVNWLNERHFDYHGLIEKGLAIEASEGMYEAK